MKKTENVPKAMREKYTEIKIMTDTFCKEHLNAEYAQTIRYAIAALCRKRPSPLTKGKAATWACGVIHAIGTINFVFDNSQSPYIKAPDIYKAFGVASSTGQGKSKTVRDLLNMNQFDPHWTLPSKLEKNPMVWMINVNGLIMDARHMPRDLQEMAFDKGLIPYIPDDTVDARQNSI